MSFQTPAQNGSGVSSWRRDTVCVAGLTAALCVAMLWPLPIQCFTHIAGPQGTDTKLALWDLWWFPNPFHWFPNLFECSDLFYPLGTSTVYHGTLLFYGALTAPVNWLLGEVAAVNCIVMFTFIASAVVCFWLCRYLGMSRSAACVAALVFAFSPFRRWRAEQHLNFLATEWPAAYTLCLMILLDARRWWAVGLLAGICMTCGIYSDYTYTVLMVLLTLIYLVVFVRFRTGRESNKRILLGLATASATAGLLSLPILLALYRTRAMYNFYVEADNIRLSADLLGFVVPPTRLLNFWRWTLPNLRGVQGAQEGVTFLGFVPLALALVALLCRHSDRRFRYWKAAFLVLFVLSLGPFLKINGVIDLFEFKGAWFREPFRLTLPYAFLQYIPFVNNARGAIRFHGVTTLPFAILVGVGFMVITRRLRGRRGEGIAAVAIAAFALIEYAAVPVPTFRPSEGPLQAIRDASPDTAVLDGTIDERDPMLRQIIHQKKLLTGHVGRIPPEIRGYVSATPLLREFADRKLSGPKQVEKYRASPGAAEMTANLVDLWGLGFVVVDPQKDRYKLGLFEGYIPYTLAASTADLEVYQLIPPVRTGLRPTRVAVGEAEWSGYLAHGWGQWFRYVEHRNGIGAIWPASPMTSVLFRTDCSRSVLASFDTYLPECCPSVYMEIWVKNHLVGTTEVPAGYATVETQLAAELVAPGLNEVELRWPDDTREYSWTDAPGAPMCLWLGSGPGSLWIRGESAYFNNRGYNIIRLSADGRRVVEGRGFDGYQDADASDKLAEFVDQIPEGSLVAFLSCGDASKNFSSKAGAALQKLGSSFDMANRPNWSHVGIGRKGMVPGQALERFSAESAVYLVPGRCAFVEFRFQEVP